MSYPAHPIAAPLGALGFQRQSLATGPYIRHY